MQGNGVSFGRCKLCQNLCIRFGREITEQECSNHQTVKHSTHSVTVYVLYTVFGFSFPYKFYTWTKASCWNRRVFNTVSGSSVEIHVSVEAGGTADTQGRKIFEIIPQLRCGYFQIPQHKRNVPRRSLQPASSWTTLLGVTELNCGLNWGLK